MKANSGFTRRQFMRHSALCGALLAGAGWGAMAGCSGPSRDDYAPNTFVLKPKDAGDALALADSGALRPNIVVILTDDQGYGDMGCYGSRSVRTPHMDRIAAEGVRFTNFYACNALCTPSRLGLLTGRYPQRGGLPWILRPEPNLKSRLVTRFGELLGRLGVTDVGKSPELDGIPGDEITLAEALHVAGYRTGLVGKWHLGDFRRDPQYFPTRHGFDHFYGVPYANRMTPFPLYRGETCIVDHIEDQGRVTGMYTRAATEFIEQSTDRPFFLYLAHTFPHAPLHASQAFRKTSNGGLYGDVVEELDWSVGEILACLKRNGLDQNTLLIFTSDNGPVYNGSTAGMRGGKGQSFEGGFRVPCMVRWPGQVPAGRVCEAPAMNIDFFPTLLGLAGVELPRDRVIDGQDISDLFFGKPASVPHKPFFFYHHNELEGIRAGKWKYFRYVNTYEYPMPIDKPHTPLGRIGRGKLGSWPLLYDMEIDPAESYNVIDTYPEIGRRLLARMVQWEERMAVNPRGWI